MRLLLGCFFLLHTVVSYPQARAEDDTLYSETEISVERYDEGGDAFVLILTQEPSVGPNYAAPEDLQKALAFEGTRAEFMKKMRNEKTAIYHLKKDLKLIGDKAFAARKLKKAKN